MPKVHHVKKARKDNSVVKRGESYYWWKFNFGAKYYSKTFPKLQQLTQSDFWIQVFDIQDSLQAVQVSDDIDEIISTIEELREEQEEKLSNMPEQLQESSTSGELLQSRGYSLEEFISELESAKDGYDEYAEDDKEAWRETVHEMQYEGE